MKVVHCRTLIKYVNTEAKCPFDDWFNSLKDIRTQAIISTRLNRIILGNFGDCKNISGKVKEMRIDFGPGYRIYFAEEDHFLVILLCAGNKNTQKKDIERAIAYWEEYNA